MEHFYINIKKAICYAFEDLSGIFIIGGILFLASLITKNDYFNDFTKFVVKAVLFIVVGYGSFILWYSINNSDEHPSIRNFKNIIWEGFQKNNCINCLFNFFNIFFSLCKCILS